ncbi:MAG: trypsin-like serine protease [Xanthomonadales bacterium]|nr:trypsin-like peptidase domain-containing protein [Gammaproteobacteria bacterium]MBT8053320.1 trypsin-like peptidase domain-containing protein [Gammaproteobacteria bacterium]NND58032.1 trypsin-like serine protease [Xanthomonadales bacterium]NNK52129.1 trypsin-like serine protease [Xanthomonadales bacterium]
MTHFRSILGFAVQAIIAGLALAFVLVYLWPSLAQRVAQVDEPPPEPVAAAPISYANAVNRAAPAVVSIYTRSLETRPANEETQQRFGLRRLYRLRQDLASGVLLSEDGYILTNHHVIALVRNIRIALWDGRIVPATVVGSDPASDLAVLKINLTGLPTAPVAENPEVQVGDVVLAIGNALGLSHTVTMGIVSATGRNDLQSLLYEDFIQTDAAINAGNSGGALINANGELIGINTRNLDSAQNIGFTIPIGIAQNVMNQIIEYGSVRRGWLGADLADVNPVAQSDGSFIRRGVGVRAVAKEGPAWSAGIRQGDLIITLDGEPVVDVNQFLLAISQREPGSKVELSVLRGTESFETYATLLQQPPL